MSKNKKKGRISRIRGNLKYTNDDPLGKKIFYVKENIKQYKGIIIIVLCLLLIIIFSVILNKRNEVLANEIIRNPNKKIYVTYGALHFPGVLIQHSKHPMQLLILSLSQIIDISSSTIIFF